METTQQKKLEKLMASSVQLFALTCMIVAGHDATKLLLILHLGCLYNKLGGANTHHLA